jgi:hypothetical protein
MVSSMRTSQVKVGAKLPRIEAKTRRQMRLAKPNDQTNCTENLCSLVPDLLDSTNPNRKLRMPKFVFDNATHVDKENQIL